MKLFAYLTTVIGIGTYLFWGYMPKGGFYVGNALFIFMLCVILYKLKPCFIFFFLLCGSFNNLMDELFFKPTVLGWNELALIIVLPAIWLYRNKNEIQRN